MNTIAGIQYHARSGAVVEGSGLLDFFQKLFAFFEAENLDPEQYCNDESSISVSWTDQSLETNIDVCDFIATAYAEMCLWHDGGQGYVLLSLLSLNYKPGPRGGNLESETRYTAIFDRHFEAGGHV